jgi:hypothetical protein
MRIRFRLSQIVALDACARGLHAQAAASLSTSVLDRTPFCVLCPQSSERARRGRRLLIKVFERPRLKWLFVLRVRK